LKELAYLMTSGLPLMINPFGELCLRVAHVPRKRGASAKPSTLQDYKNRRESQLRGFRRTWIKPTVLDTFKKVLQSLEVWDDEAFNKTDLIYSAHGSTFEFYGLDDSQKLHGIETDYFWLNEAIETSKDDFDQLEQRCKGKWILDYNPSTDEHWIYDNVLKRDDVYSSIQRCWTTPS
jgi:hypothetical protein